MYEVISTKFILKSFVSDDNMIGLLYQLEQAKDHPFHDLINLLKDYTILNYKENIPQTRHLDLHEISIIGIQFSKDSMRRYRNYKWLKYLEAKRGDTVSESFSTQLSCLHTELIDEFNDVPKLLFPRWSTKFTDVKILAAIHGHNLCYNNYGFRLGIKALPTCER